ncbi:hypothetical protein Vafri_3256, partial [Volvox africanus]
ALEAIKAGYEKVILRLKVNGIKSDPFASAQGVKQGCPLSPTLYGIFGEAFADLVDALDAHIPGYMSVEACPVVDGLRIPLLLYADDLTLFARSRSRMERLLEVLSRWCETFGMHVNVKKTEMLEVAPSPEIRRRMRKLPPLQMVSHEDGCATYKQIEVVDRARYLGIHYGTNTSFVSCTKELLNVGQRA